MNIVLQLFPSKLVSEVGDRIVDWLSEMRCDGVIWLEPHENELPIIRSLEKDKVLCVLTSRGRDGSYTSVETDFESAGFKAGNLFRKAGCEQVYLFSYYEEDNGDERILRDIYKPIGLRQGLARAFDFQYERLHVVPIKGYTDAAINTVIKRLEKIGSGCGVLFNDSHQLLSVLDKGDEQVLEHLRKNYVVVNRGNDDNTKLLQLAEGVDLYVLVEDKQKIARLAVQKLIGLTDGLLMETTTLVDVELKKASDIEAAERCL